MPQAADEYDRYVGVVGDMLRQEKTEDEIEQYLRWVRTDYMCLGAETIGEEHEREATQRDRRAASRLAQWYSVELADRSTGARPES